MKDCLTWPMWHTKMHFSAKCNSGRIAIQWFHIKHYLDYQYTKFQPYTFRVQKMCVFARYATLVPRLYIGRRQYQRYSYILFCGNVSVSQLVASMSCVVLGCVVEVVVRISLEAKYLQHLTAQLIIYPSVFFQQPVWSLNFQAVLLTLLLRWRNKTSCLA